MILLAFALCLCFDFYMNRGENMGEILRNLENIFDKSQILFFMSHLTFIFLSYCIFALNMQNLGILFIYILCILSIITEILTIKKYKNGEISAEILEEKISLIYKISIYFVIFIIFYFTRI